MNYQVGSQQLLAGPIYPQQRYTVGGVSIPMDRVWFTVTIIAVALVLTGVFRLTPFGLATRASAESEAGAGAGAVFDGAHVHRRAGRWIGRPES